MRPGSDTSGKVPRDHRNPIPLRTEGSLAFWPDLHSYYMPFAPEAVTSSSAIPYSWQVSRIGTGHLIDKPKRRFQYENHNEIQYLPADGGDDSDSGACHPG